MQKSAERLNWQNLSKNKCPKCERDWPDHSSAGDGMITCVCGFQIREKRMAQIVSSQSNRSLDNYFRGKEIERESW